MIVRQAEMMDATRMAAILNEIIATGGTTAHQAPISSQTVRLDCIDGPRVSTSVVTEDQGQITGWQSIGLLQGNADIGALVQPGIQTRGIGAVLSALTCDCTG